MATSISLMAAYGVIWVHMGAYHGYIWLHMFTIPFTHCDNILPSMRLIEILAVHDLRPVLMKLIQRMHQGWERVNKVDPSALRAYHDFRTDMPIVPSPGVLSVANELTRIIANGHHTDYDSFESVLLDLSGVLPPFQLMHQCLKQLLTDEQMGLLNFDSHYAFLAKLLKDCYPENEPIAPNGTLDPLAEHTLLHAFHPDATMTLPRLHNGSKYLLCLAISEAQGNTEVTFGKSTERPHVRTYDNEYLHVAFDLKSGHLWHTHRDIASISGTEFINCVDMMRHICGDVPVRTLEAFARAKKNEYNPDAPDVAKPSPTLIPTATFDVACAVHRQLHIERPLVEFMRDALSSILDDVSMDAIEFATDGHAFELFVQVMRDLIPSYIAPERTDELDSIAEKALKACYHGTPAEVEKWLMTFNAVSHR